MIVEIIRTIRFLLFKLLVNPKPIKIILFDPSKVSVKDMSQLFDYGIIGPKIKVNGLPEAVKVIDTGIFFNEKRKPKRKEVTK